MYVRTDDLTHPKPLPLSQLRALYLAEFTSSAARQIPLSAIAVSRALSSSFVLLGYIVPTLQTPSSYDWTYTKVIYSNHSELPDGK